ncbi:hypothetical protein GEOBRER4_n1013 [Citrifermentans bremense]|uniref:Uncharacterized protein n=1 Tax=Citrifermentans bremense TaxID=60035 RepID=A0A7R7FSV1_9BACT|nr:hypothetical protein GEOBRER4_n1013 [Citrifermentans bremense]
MLLELTQIQLYCVGKGLTASVGVLHYTAASPRMPDNSPSVLFRVFEGT